MNEKVCLIVDGYSASSFLPAQLKKQGYQCIHLQTTLQPMRILYLTNAEEYLETFIYDSGDLKEYIKRITDRYKILCVFAGTESGVILAHTIAALLNLKHNKLELLSACRNKYDMIEAVKKAGLKTADHFKTDKFEEAKKWVTEQNRWPIVVKPIDSAGTNNVFICHTMEEVGTAFNTIYGSLTNFDKKCEEVLLQTFLAGEEYVVNAVTCNGAHFAAEIMHYHKRYVNGHWMYDHDDLLDPTRKDLQPVIEYAKKIASAVGIQYGPTHIEIKMTEEGPALVEIAARIGGNTRPDLGNACFGYNVFDLTIFSYLDESKFFETVGNASGLKKHSILAVISEEKGGYLYATPIKETLNTCESVLATIFSVQIGQKVSPTVCL